ncbi:MAG: SDR family NAD(P)-dependent oxidoreductase [Pseudomonadota bacterium]
MASADSDSRTVLITGAARGIGLGIASAFAARGCRVMLADLGAAGDDWNYALATSAELDDAVASLGAGDRAAACALDVTSAASCAAAVAATVDRFGALDVLINNAGVVASGAIDSFTEADWDRVFAVNTKGIFLMSQAALPRLRQSGDAAIVNTASIAGKSGSPNLSAYCGSKFAAIGITQSLAQELAADDIRVNALCPGIVGTAMWLDHLMRNQGEAAFEERMESFIPLGRPQTVADMGEAAVYLASAPNVTGVALSVAGGIEMH